MISLLIFSQVFVALTALWVIVSVEEKSFKEFDNSERLALFAAVLFAPLTLMAFLGFFMYTVAMDKRVSMINRIINQWTIEAHNTLLANAAPEDRWQDIIGGNDEFKYAALREALKNISTKDVQLMFKTPPNIYKFEEAMYKMIMDEFVNRELLGEK